MERIQTALQKAKEQHGTAWRRELPPTSPTLPTLDMPWPKIPVRQPDLKVMAKNRIVTASHGDPAHAAFDILRTRLQHEFRQNNWTSVGITSPTPGCGKTMVSLNLAFSLANQKNCRVVVVDLDLRRPQVAKTLGIANPCALETYFKEQSDITDVFVRYGDNVAVAANGRPVRFSAELLQAPETTRVLKAMKQRLCPNVIIYDLPPILANDDVMAFLPNVDCAILVVAAEATTVSEADLCERELSERTKMLGVVLNKCRYTPDKYGY
ncbi:CpsD/CapB family tyrosine-protein kinase [Aminobacter sp. AP02]|uniref:CpsD/CapB family tyrosine-protein kinase n=1 Tax=Aminobacter sp. AP02 TaxID=2135737 RepID=UPI000D7A89B4|nr:CpsD/CapB family tyrosine-protein kinase [Aminobacter sp. AP02]PWK76865.1 Mrp family chromosome partitioning ATPase [Aminobacter sp. AP02]